MFANEHGDTYAGQCSDGHACGLGMLAYPTGLKVYAEHGPDGQYDGRCLFGWPFITYYRVYECGLQKDEAVVYAHRGKYNDEMCAPDDPRLLALIAHVAPVEALASAAAKEAEEAVEALPRRLAGLELMIAALLARYREPTVASEIKLASGLLTLPSGLLAMVCEAIVR